MSHILKVDFFKPLFSFLIVLFFCFNIQVSFAKEYYYKDFEVDIKINQDSTFDVAEKQTYYLDGNFGFFNRDVATKGTDAITDIEVFDGNNSIVPKSELDIKSISGAKHIQWNFPRHDFEGEEKSWIVKYKVHGGISFLKNYDEIYWNAVPSVRDVLIQNVKVTISLENEEKFNKDLIRLYAEDISKPLFQTPPSLPLSKGRNDWSESVGSKYNSQMLYNNQISIGGYYFDQDNTEAIFWGRNIKPNTNFTVAVGFPKGIVSQSAYFKDFLGMYYGYIISIIIVIFSLITGFLYWYKTEKSREGKRAIVPQYEPPQNLKPAMAEVIIKEKLTDKGLAATIIDLAVRGYVMIEEDRADWTSFAGRVLLVVAFIVFILFFGFAIAGSYSLGDIVMIVGVFLIMSFFYFGKYAKKLQEKMPLVPRDYILTRTELIDDDLEDYEKEYLQALFGLGDHFSTKELKKSQTKARVLYEKIKKVKDKIYEETELDTGAFEIGLTIEKRKNLIWVFLFFAIIIILWITGWISGAGIQINQFFILITVAILSSIGLWAFIKYEARLSDSGIKLKEDWLGFKMYLETAEKYRMQNLKPEYFEKYLPYAMIFGVEKKWARAFEAMNIPQPAWYGGNAIVAGHIGSANVASSFSPSAFSSSFASSFSSAFSSSGASGASGGGGGAGGGGGGGGGGAG